MVMIPLVIYITISNTRDINSHVEDTEGIDLGQNNDNESTNSLDTMLAFGGLEAEGCLGNVLPSSQANVTVLKTAYDNE